jgi:hypothetical protein
MMRVLVLSACYVVSLAAVLGFAVAALRDEGASVRLGSALFVVISLAAMAARLVWGRLADLRGKDGATRRWQVLAAIWVVLTLGALGYWAVTPLEPAAQLPMMALFAFGALGANGVLQLISGELSGPGRPLPVDHSARATATVARAGRAVTPDRCPTPPNRASGQMWCDTPGESRQT